MRKIPIKKILKKKIPIKKVKKYPYNKVDFFKHIKKTEKKIFFLKFFFGI